MKARVEALIFRQLDLPASVANALAAQSVEPKLLLLVFSRKASERQKLHGDGIVSERDLIDINRARSGWLARPRLVAHRQQGQIERRRELEVVADNSEQVVLVQKLMAKVAFPSNLCDVFIRQHEPLVAKANIGATAPTFPVSAVIFEYRRSVGAEERCHAGHHRWHGLIPFLSREQRFCHNVGRETIGTVAPRVKGRPLSDVEGLEQRDLKKNSRVPNRLSGSQD